LGAAYVLMGTPSERRGLGRLGLGGGPDLSLPGRLLRELPGVDVRIVADPTLRGQGAERVPAARRSPGLNGS
jgi:hypothetical protein